MKTRRQADVTADRGRNKLRQEIATSAAEIGRYVDATADRLRDDVRRHFNVVAEGSEIRVFADTLASHTDRLDQHESRITELERRPIERLKGLGRVRARLIAAAG